MKLKRNSNLTVATMLVKCWTMWLLAAGMIFFQLFNWFQLFFCEKEIPKIAGQSEQVKIDLF
jgi:hypothetical protein